METNHDEPAATQAGTDPSHLSVAGVPRQTPTEEWYEEVKQVLQVPWMGVITMAYAHYPTFYETWLQGVRDLCASQPFVDACLSNRAFVEKEVLELNPPPIGDRLSGIGYAPREIDDIRQSSPAGMATRSRRSGNPGQSPASCPLNDLVGHI